MKEEKKILRIACLLFIAIMGFGYLIGAFIFTSFDVSNWSMEGRVVASIMSFFTALLISVASTIRNY